MLIRADLAESAIVTEIINDVTFFGYKNLEKFGKCGN